MPNPAVPALVPALPPAITLQTYTQTVPRVIILEDGGKVKRPTACSAVAGSCGASTEDRWIDLSIEQVRFRRRQNSNKWYPPPRAQPVEDECRPMYDWQLASYPACNGLHEWNLGDQLTSDDDVGALGQGTWRVTFKVKEYDGSALALKTIRTGGHHGEGEFNAQNYEFHRTDAIVYEQLSASPNVLRMFGHCGLSGLFELADGGVLQDHLWPIDEESGNELSADWTMLERLRIAAQVAVGLADVHSIGNGPDMYPPYSQSDLQVDQILLVDGTWKLSDFNRGYFIRWNVKWQEPCGYLQVFHPGDDPARSPEEHRYDILTEKVDIWHLGTIIYTVMTNIAPYDDIKDRFEYRDFSDVVALIVAGEKPTMFDGLVESTDPAVIAMMTAVNMCLNYQPEERATATEVADYLTSRLREIEQLE